jgi:CHAD domain-containing protein
MVIEALAYSFKPGESIHTEVQRIVSEELDSAIEHLEGRGEPDRDEAIHEARKNVKKVRGVLRLVRPELGMTYAVETQRLRDVGRSLSEFRDAGAMLEIFDQLNSRYGEDWGARPGIASIRTRLVEAKAGHAFADVLSAAGQELRAVRENVKDWPLHTGGFEAIAHGLERTYRNGRRAMQRALDQPSAENFHALRKRVKDHWYHVRLIGRFCGDALSFYQQNLKDLESYLGDDHNLTVLRQKVAGQPHVGEPDVPFFWSAVENYQSTLRSNAVLLGQDIYQDKPNVFLGQLRSLWQAWVQDRVAILR